MLKRVSALCAFGLALSALSLQAQDLFVLPGAGAASGEVQAFVTNPLTTFRTFNAGAGSFALLPNLDASKFFIIATSNMNSVLASDGTFLDPALVANLSTPATQAIVTPDGKLLAVAAGTLQLFNTTTNAELLSSGFGSGSSFNAFAVASSLDASTIFALGSNGAGTSQLTAISTTTYAATATLPLSPVATGVSVAPNGLVYVSLPNQIVEIDPATLQPTFNGTISVSGTPGPLVFTPDGQYGLAANQSSFGNSLFIVALATHTATNPVLGLPSIASLLVTGVDTVLALTSQGLVEVTILPQLSANQVQPPGVSPTGVVGMTSTNDVPAGAHSSVQAVYVASANTLFEFDPASGSFPAQSQIAANITPGALAYAVPAVTSAQANPASLLTYGANQTLMPGATSEPLVVRVLGSNNVPLSGETVQFQSSLNGATLSPASAITTANGYALTYLTAPATPGPVTVTATIGSLTATFPIEVSGTAQGAGGPTLTIVAGQGQLMFAETNTAAGSQYGSPLQVLASDVNGNPIAGLPITFSVPSDEGTLVVNYGGAATQTVNTNADGVASVDFFTTELPDDDQQGYLQSLVTASAANAKAVTFYITTLDSSVYIYLKAPKVGAILTGPEGSTVAGGVEVEILSPSGDPIPNVSLGLSDNNANPSLVPTISCDAPGGLALTNMAGIATCNVTFGPRTGSGTYIPTAGYTHPLGALPFTVTVGPPGTVQITQGNNQTGGPGQRLPFLLVVHVTDSAGNTLTGAPVNWQILTPGTVTLSNVVSATNSLGNASAVATLGAIGGPAQVQVTSGSASATFNLTVDIPSVGIQKVSGDQQTTTIDMAFTSPLIVKVVDSNGNGVAGTQVNFQVTTGVATLGSSSAITDSSGQASTTVTAGGTFGAITVTASSSSFSVTFTLTALPIGPNNITIENGASFDPSTGISPGAIAIVKGTGILPGVQGLISAANSAGELPTSFSGVTITFNGTAAPIYYVQDTNGADEVAVQVPFEVQPGPSVALTVDVAISGSAPVIVPVKPLAPGVFTSIYNGEKYAAAVRPDGSHVSPTNPAHRGENIQLYITGLGQATPTIATGAPGVSDQAIVAPIIIGLNNSPVPIISAVYGPGLIGMYVVTVEVPMDTRTGPHQPVGVIAHDSANNSYFAQNTYIPIQ
jgi:uncharacterized protein (TIGR03437 family)